MKDHRELGRELELFFFDEISPGSVFWLPKGMIIFRELEKFIRETIEGRGYTEISTPIIVKSELFKKSGHWEFFKDNMFNLSVWDKEEELQAIKLVVQAVEEKSKQGKIESPTTVVINFQNEEFEVRVQEIKYEGSNVLINGISLPVNYSVKPMNCPESTVVYNFKTRSYRDLPLRLSEFGRLHRNERSGTLNGMFRVRQMVMDDAHVFCRMDQIQAEITDMLDVTLELYNKLKLPITFGLATRPEKAMGSKETWADAEDQLAKSLKSHKLDYQTLKGEGAFYGPKIHIDYKDSLGRTWTMATIQVDFQMPEGLNLTYTDEQSKEQRPVMVHRAILGSFERFVGIATEIYQGAFPIWLSPIQAQVLPISDKFLEYAKSVAKELKEASIRVEVDERNETLQAKIRDATVQKVPYLLVVGSKEEESKKVAVRTREGEDLGVIPVSEFSDKIASQIENKA